MGGFHGEVHSRADLTTSRRHADVRVEAHWVTVCLARVAAVRSSRSAICAATRRSRSATRLDGEEVECPAHGSRFNVRTGEVSGLPAEDPVATYTVIIGDGKIISDA